jgi:hypothetical protein
MIQPNVDEAIKRAIDDLRSIGSPVTSANVADVVTDRLIRNVVDDSILWREVDSRVRKRYGLASDADEVPDPLGTPTR